MKKYHLLPAVFLFIGFHAHSFQVIEPVEGTNTFAKVSEKETTRLAIENGKIRSIIATDGEISVDKDDERGQIFLRPLVKKPINMRVISASGATYNLILQTVDIPQEDIIIREPFSPKGSASHSGGGKGQTKKRVIRDLVASMALDEPPTSISFRKANEEFALWEGTRFVLTGVYQDRGLVGQRFVLTNTGKNPIRVAEQEFYRKGVIAVAVETMEIDPGRSTPVYILREQ